MNGLDDLLALRPSVGTGRTRAQGCAAAVVVGIRGATAYAPSINRGEAWNQLTDEAEADAIRIESMTTLPDGTTGVERLTGTGLAEAQVRAIETALADPDRLLALDGGAVRAEFMDGYDRNDSQQGLADRVT